MLNHIDGSIFFFSQPHGCIGFSMYIVVVNVAKQRLGLFYDRTESIICFKAVQKLPRLVKNVTH